MSAEFLTQILLKPALYSRATAADSGTFKNLVIKGNVSITNKSIKSNIVIDGAVFCDDVDFSGSNFARGLKIVNSIVLSNARSFEFGKISFSESSTGLNLTFSKSVAAIIDASGATIGGDMHLYKNRVGHLNLRAVKSNGRINLNGTRQETKEGFLRVVTDNSLPHLDRTAFFDLGLLSAQGSLNLDSLDIDSHLVLFGANVRELKVRCSNLPSIDFREVSVEKSITIGNTVLGDKNRPFYGSCHTTNIFKSRSRGLYAMNLKIGQDLLFVKETKCEDSSTPSDTKSPVEVFGRLCLSKSKLGGSFVMAGGVFDAVSVDQLAVNQSITLINDEAVASWRKWQTDDIKRRGPQFDLRFSKLGPIQSCFNSIDWPQSRLLSGTIINGLEALSCESGSRLPLSSTSMSTRIRRFLASADFTVERTGPYLIFQRYFREIGLPHAAEELAYAAQEKVTGNESRWWKLPFRWLKKYFGGYGLDPTYPTLVALLIAFIGTNVAFLTQRTERYFRSRKIEQPFKLIKVYFECFVFSVDRLIPVFTLLKGNKDWSFNKSHFARVYFICHAFTGWLLASMVTLFISKIVGISL